MHDVSPAEISVIVVNYGTAALAIAAVESVLARGHGGRAVDVHLVDNASPGDDAAVLRAAHAGRGWGGRVTLYPETVNHGFGRGNNLVLRALAARAVPPRMVMLLNPDARLENEAVEILARALDADPQAGVAGAGIASPEGVAVSAAFRFPSAMGEFAHAMNFGPVARLCRRWEVSLPPDQPGGPVDWVCGAAMMARMSALQDVGFFDPAFFLYYEEVDLMRQMRRRGWRTLYVPAARVTHSEGSATGVKGDRLARRPLPPYWYRSWHHYFVKNHGRPGAAIAGAGWMAGAACDHVIARLRGKRPHAPGRFFRDFWGIVGRPLLGLAPASRD